MTALHPSVLWAQRADRVLLTIDVQDCKDPKITLEDDGKLSFRGHAHSHATGPEEHAYTLDLELYGPINKDDTKQATTDRTVTLAVAKAEPGFWPRLLKAAGKTPQFIKVDWDKWVDEDDVDEAGPGGLGDFDLSALQNFQNFGDFGGGAMGGGDSSDDEEGEEALPPLEQA